MRGLRWWPAVVAMALAACEGARRLDEGDIDRPTTGGAIAVANLDHSIARHGDEPEVVELLLERSRFLSDYEALARAVVISERRVETADDHMRRARTRSAEHRFAEALADLSAAEQLGADREKAREARALVLLAMGCARRALVQLEAGADRRPGFASRSALAGAYAMVGRLADADSLYVAALADLETTSPFPYAWIHFARGVMWAEQGADTALAEAEYHRALGYLPAFAAANIHLAELEAARGDLASALARMETVARAGGEPEALALLGALYQRLGDATRGRRELVRARERFESLLVRHPMAIADHAAEFYLGPGGDADRAWLLARRNLIGRNTPRALALAVRAASAAGRRGEACELAARLAVANRGAMMVDAGVADGPGCGELGDGSGDWASMCTGEGLLLSRLRPPTMITSRPAPLRTSP